MLSIICVGKLKEKPLRALSDEYLKRLNRFDAIEEIELNDLPERENASDKDRENLIQKEGQDILSRVGPRDYVIALCIEGKQVDSEGLAKRFESIRLSGHARIVFIIGGSLGLSPNVKARANEKLSMSKMTFPHGLARVMLLEQIYRAHKITAGERYHK
jgi:Uncharacterized conserved protein